MEEDARLLLRKADLLKYEARLVLFGFTDLETLLDREVLDDATLAKDVGMTKLDIRKFRALLQRDGAKFEAALARAQNGGKDGGKQGGSKQQGKEDPSSYGGSQQGKEDPMAKDKAAKGKASGQLLSAEVLDLDALASESSEEFMSPEAKEKAKIAASRRKASKSSSSSAAAAAVMKGADGKGGASSERNQLLKDLKKNGLLERCAPLFDHGVDSVEALAAKDDAWLKATLQLSKMELRKLRIIAPYTAPAGAAALDAVASMIDLDPIVSASTISNTIEGGGNPAATLQLRTALKGVGLLEKCEPMFELGVESAVDLASKDDAWLKEKLQLTKMECRKVRILAPYVPVTPRVNPVALEREESADLSRGFNSFLGTTI